jgi:hypothetical protein
LTNIFQNIWTIGTIYCTAVQFELLFDKCHCTVLNCPAELIKEIHFPRGDNCMKYVLIWCILSQVKTEFIFHDIT